MYFGIVSDIIIIQNIRAIVNIVLIIYERIV